VRELLSGRRRVARAHQAEFKKVRTIDRGSRVSRAHARARGSDAARAHTPSAASLALAASDRARAKDARERTTRRPPAV